MSAITPSSTATAVVKRRSEAAEARLKHLKRLGSCLVLGFVLALMIGDQEGTQDDFGYAFREAVFGPRILVFLGIGVLIYLAVTFWPYLAAYLRRPGIRPMAAGALSIVAANGLLNWSDSGQLDNGRLASLARAARGTGDLDPVTRLFFGSAVPGTHWLLLILVVALGVTAIVRSNASLAWIVAALSAIIGLWGMYAVSAVHAYLGNPDHATGGLVSLLGYLAFAAAAVTVAKSSAEEADTRGFVDRVFSWRPGMPLVALGAVLGLLSMVLAGWFSPTDRNDKFFGLSNRFGGSDVTVVSSSFYTWLGPVLLLAAVGLTGYAAHRRLRTAALVGVGVAVLGVVLTVFVLYDISKVGADAGFNASPGPWNNLGVGGWLLAVAFTLLCGAGWIARRAGGPEQTREVDSDHLQASSANVTQAIFFLVVAAALFYPPMATQFWQTVLVTQIGIYVLLAIGLNVVVGWAGLLDLGFIAFYAIGSYTTAYFTGRLPVRPPDWLELSPLAAIPFAVVVCLIAGVALGAPTLRLRGDYLAIVTLGFGEIIRVVANNATGFTNGPRGAFNIPPPSIKLGPIDITWGGSALGYWYLLLALVVLVVVLFNRLEHSRLGRAWAAIREDEVAAQATGINTTKVKLLAFAIGASTSGLAGVFFASQVGSFTPENFILANSILVVAYVVFGGMGSLPGAMAGAAVLTWLPEFLKAQVPAEDRQMWIGAIILLMMIFRPAGLIPAKRRRAELSGLDAPDSSESAAVPRRGAM